MDGTENMSEPKPRCGRCKWRNHGGYCTCPKIYEKGLPPDGEAEKASDHLVYSYNEGGGFWVGENFGCVHGEEAIAHWTTVLRELAE